MSITFEVMGEPRPKQSFRYSGRGGGYTAAPIKAWQDAVAWEAKIAMKGMDMLSGNLSVTMVFKLGNKRRVDLDNLSKAVLDAMNGVVYEDDTIVCKLDLYKYVANKDTYTGVTVLVDTMEVEK